MHLINRSNGALDIPIMFKMGVRVLMLIDRSEGNTNKGSKRWINKIITSNPDEFDRALDKLIALQDYLGSPSIRLYVSANDRNMGKAIKALKHQQIDLHSDNEYKFYSRINDSFVSCLMKPNNRASSLFLIDVDTKCHDEILEVEDFLQSFTLINALYKYETPNGWHYITEPFNPYFCHNLSSMDVKKDALMLVRFIQ